VGHLALLPRPRFYDRHFYERHGTYLTGAGLPDVWM
jgi:hypothetical protein